MIQHKRMFIVASLSLLRPFPVASLFGLDAECHPPPPNVQSLVSKVISLYGFDSLQTGAA
jgi:hypothetical protein